MCPYWRDSNGFVLIFEQEHTVLNNRDFAFLLPIAIFCVLHQLFTYTHSVIMLGDKGVVAEVCVALFIYSHNIVANVMGRLGKGRHICF